MGKGVIVSFPPLYPSPPHKKSKKTLNPHSSVYIQQQPFPVCFLLSLRAKTERRKRVSTYMWFFFRGGKASNFFSVGIAFCVPHPHPPRFDQPTVPKVQWPLYVLLHSESQTSNWIIVDMFLFGKPCFVIVFVTPHILPTKQGKNIFRVREDFEIKNKRNQELHFLLLTCMCR